MYNHSHTFRRERKVFNLKFLKFGQNYNFSGSDKEIFGQKENFSGSDKKNLGKIKNFREVIRVQKNFCAKCRKKFMNVGEDHYFLLSTMFLERKLRNLKRNCFF